jgi:serine phosphatase RsbU (regulator of sigma subunit)
VLRHLLSREVDLPDAISQVNAVLLRRNAYASLVLVSIEKATGRVDYVNAGHLPPLVFEGDGARSLDGPHGTWLGLPVSSSQVVVTDTIEPGGTLLLFTDGLVEERGEVIDVSIDHLAARARRLGAAPSALVEGLLDHRLSDRSERTVDDDIAVVAIRRAFAR